jgi:hypothetical protein
MKVRKTTAVLLLSGVLLSLGSCASEVGYYVLSALPDILSALSDTTTTTA